MKKLVAAAICFSCLIISGCTDVSIPEENSESISYQKVNNKKLIEASDYTKDTIYTGADIPYQLYTMPFNKTDKYVKNRILLKSLEESEVNQYIDTAESFFSLIFQNNYRDILNDQDAFVQTYHELYVADYIFVDDVQIDITDRAYEFLEWYIDNEISTQCSFTTDKSLIFKDGYMYFLRCCICIIAYTGKDSIPITPFNIEFTEGEERRFIVDIEFIPGNPENINTISIIKEI